MDGNFSHCDKCGGKHDTDDCPTYYTEAELNEFRELVEKSESLQQMDRIDSRLRLPEFIERVGKEKCDVMFEVLKKELK